MLFRSTMVAYFLVQPPSLCICKENTLLCIWSWRKDKNGGKWSWWRTYHKQWLRWCWQNSWGGCYWWGRGSWGRGRHNSYSLGQMATSKLEYKSATSKNWFKKCHLLWQHSPGWWRRWRNCQKLPKISGACWMSFLSKVRKGPEQILCWIPGHTAPQMAAGRK